MTDPYRAPAGGSGEAAPRARLKAAWIAVALFAATTALRIARDLGVPMMEAGWRRSAIVWAGWTLYIVGLGGVGAAVTLSTPRCGPESGFRDRSLVQGAMVWAGTAFGFWGFLSLFVLDWIVLTSVLVWNVVDLLRRTRALRRA